VAFDVLGGNAVLFMPGGIVSFIAAASERASRRSAKKRSQAAASDTTLSG